MRSSLYTLGGIALTALVGWGALQLAIARNGPAVLDIVDRLAGGSSKATIVERASTGAYEQQKVIVWGPERTQGDARTRPVLLFVHGGSWRDGDPDDYGFVGRAFVPEGFVVVLAGYRLGEAGIYPAMLQDTAAAIRWTSENIAEHGGDPDRIVLAGHSAGAYNVVTTALDTRWLAAEGVRPGRIRAVIGLAGPYDFVPFDKASTIAAFGHVDDPDITQPLAHLHPGSPPMLLVHGGADETVKIRNSRALATGLEQAGGRVRTLFFPDMDHSDPLISFAAPWRSRRNLFEKIADHARTAATLPQTSVPVQGEEG